MRQEIIFFLTNWIPIAYEHRELSTSYYHDLENGFSVVLCWEEGFDTKDAHELCLSLRKTKSSYFVDDWTVVEEDWSLDENGINYEEETDILLDVLNSTKTG